MCLADLFQGIELILRKKLCIDLIDPGIFSYSLCTVFGVSSEHNGVETKLFQRSNGFLCVRFDGIGDQHISCEGSVYCHKYFRAVSGFL